MRKGMVLPPETYTSPTQNKTESAHAIRAVIDEALRCKASGEPKTLFFNLSGHGHFDMAAYEAYFSGKLEDFEYPAEAIQASLAKLPKVAEPA